MAAFISCPYPSTSAALQCNFMHLADFLNATIHFATFLPSACLSILALDVQMKAFTVKANSGMVAFNPTAPGKDF